MSYGYLMKAADEMQPEFHLQAKLVAPLTLAAETDVLVKQIAHECGGVFVRFDTTASQDALTAKPERPRLDVRPRPHPCGC